LSSSASGCDELLVQRLPIPGQTRHSGSAVTTSTLSLRPAICCAHGSAHHSARDCCIRSTGSDRQRSIPLGTRADFGVRRLLAPLRRSRAHCSTGPRETCSSDLRCAGGVHTDALGGAHAHKDAVLDEEPRSLGSGAGGQCARVPCGQDVGRCISRCKTGRCYTAASCLQLAAASSQLRDWRDWTRHWRLERISAPLRRLAASSKPTAPPNTLYLLTVAARCSPCPL
jgi:hypothetical protein